MGIRPADIADGAAIVALWNKCGLTRPWNDPQGDFILALENACSDVLVFESANDITAVIMVGFDGHRGWVYYLGVDCECRKQGLGRKMMAAAESWLESRDAPKIQLMVRNDNVDAIAFYAAIGFDVQPVITMGKRLA